MSLVYNWENECEKWGFNYPVKMILGSIEERTDLICYFRSQYLMSLGLDLYKSIQPARLQTEFQPLLDGTAVVKTDPKCTVDYCNRNKRGICQFSDYFINCYKYYIIQLY